MSYDEEFGRVVESSGEYARPEALNGHLVIVFPIGYHEHLQTRFTMPGKKSDALCCDIVDLDDKDSDGVPGKVYRSSNLMQSQLIVSLRPFIGKKVLGRIGKGVGKAGMNSPWVLTDLSTDQVCLERAKAWKAANPDFITSAFAARDQFATTGDSQWLAGHPGMEPETPLLTREEAYALQARLAAGHQQRLAAEQLPAQPAPTQYYQQEAAPQVHQPQPVAAAPVAGAANLSAEELTMLQKLRMEKARREAAEKAAANPFDDTPPF